MGVGLGIARVVDIFSFQRMRLLRRQVYCLCRCSPVGFALVPVMIAVSFAASGLSNVLNESATTRCPLQPLLTAIDCCIRLLRQVWPPENAENRWVHVNPGATSERRNKIAYIQTPLVGHLIRQGMASGSLKTEKNGRPLCGLCESPGSTLVGLQLKPPRGARSMTMITHTHFIIHMAINHPDLLKGGAVPVRIRRTETVKISI